MPVAEILDQINLVRAPTELSGLFLPPMMVHFVSYRGATCACKIESRPKIERCPIRCASVLPVPRDLVESAVKEIMEHQRRAKAENRKAG
jgi:hypothetical protein